MSKFVYQLDGVLRQRKHAEEQRQRELAGALADLTAAEAQLRALDQSVQSNVADLRDNRLIGRIDLNFLAAHRRYMAATQRKALGLAEQVAAAQRKVDDARRALLEAAKQRKILEKLRERRQAVWAADLDRKESAATDEIGTQIGHRLARDGPAAETSSTESDWPDDVSATEAGFGREEAL